MDELLNIENQNRKNNKMLFDTFSKKNTDHFDLLTIKKKQRFSNLITHGNAYYILEGVVMRYFTDMHGQSKALDIFMKDEIIGLDSLNGPRPVQFGLKALTNVKLAIISLAVIETHKEEVYPILYCKYQYVFCLFFLNWKYSLYSGDVRIKITIISLCKYLGGENDGSYLLPKYITHEIISEFSAVTRPYVTRVIAKLVENKLLITSRKGIKVLNLEHFIEVTPEYLE